ncbi:hypothetical protein BDV96DRAFT_487952 [Lophiotrema nucula]|uniref:FAD-binding PCMH-type domain-containing protein n=1 Tax=Lophiotrema nucula TaxID=690887 RepID=A0A6A5ZJ41_9PLEO|nr:hypothetical protein BDV96DRAFT_487952 [Lophiotrema nucula]
MLTCECECQCLQLVHALSSHVSFPGNTTYVAAEQSYWSLQEARLSPACIVTPESAADVAKAVATIVGAGNCDFAIRGQSHAPAAGFANIEAGVTIDMRKLGSISVNLDSSVAHVGAGASWLDVYTYLDTLNVSVAGGRNGAVGVGGLLLGGGISYFAPRVGWACDNVVNFEIMLASGHLVNANATSKPDLFRALKGGANNFGVVTRFDIATFAQGEILAGKMSSPFSERQAVFKAFAHLADARHYDPYASLVLGLTWTPATGWATVTSTAAYTKPVLNPPTYNEFLSVPNTTSTLGITKLSTYANETATPPLEWVFYTGTYGVSADLLSSITDTFNETMSTTNIPGLVLWTFAFEPLPTIITQYFLQKGGNSLGTTPADGNSVVLLITALWNSTASDALVEQTAGKMVKDANAIAQKMGLLKRFQYINYADPSQDPIASYGEQNVQYLLAASQKYDPKGVFQRKVPGGFKLPARQHYGLV